MRQTGYYFVKLKERSFALQPDTLMIAEYRKSERTFTQNGGVGEWHFVGTSTFPRHKDHDMSYISPTPITPEKMAAIDEIITCRDGKYTLDSMVNDILDKYKLL